MGNINRINPVQPTQAPAQVQKQLKQDKPTPGVVYAEVHRSEGDAEETIQAILHFAQQKVLEKRGGNKDGKGKKKKKAKQTKQKAAGGRVPF